MFPSTLVDQKVMSQMSKGRTSLVDLKPLRYMDHLSLLDHLHPVTPSVTTMTVPSPTEHLKHQEWGSRSRFGQYVGLPWYRWRDSE